jgi:hypothetical protein
VCSGTPWRRAISAISGIGWIAPVSLLAYITEISAVSGKIAASMIAGSTTPCSSTGTTVKPNPMDASHSAL